MEDFTVGEAIKINQTLKSLKNKLNAVDKVIQNKKNSLIQNENELKEIIDNSLDKIQKKIIELDNIYSKIEQIEFIKKVFERDINYNTYMQFFNKYCKYTNSNKGVNKTDSKDKVSKINEVSTSEETPVDNKNNKTKKSIISEYKEIADSYGNCLKNNDDKDLKKEFENSFNEALDNDDKENISLYSIMLEIIDDPHIVDGSGNKEK